MGAHRRSGGQTRSRLEPVAAGDPHVERINALIARTTAAVVESRQRIERAKTLAAASRRFLAAFQQQFPLCGHTGSAIATLQKLKARFLREHDVQTLLEETLAAALTATGTDRGNVQIVDWRTKSLRIVAQRGFDADFLEFFARVRAEGACGKALRSLVFAPKFAHMGSDSEVSEWSLAIHTNWSAKRMAGGS